jgi:hypothetical protein
MRNDTRAESNRSCIERRLGATCFLYAMMRVVKVIGAERYINR